MSTRFATQLFLFAVSAGVLVACSSREAPPEPQAQLQGFAKGSVEHIRQVTESIDDSALKNADDRPGDWLSYGRNYREDRYSPLNQVNKSNLKELGLAWTIDLGTKRGIQATPLVVDGIMYLSGPWSVVYAIDTRKGEILWQYDPGVDRDRAIVFCCGVVNKGVSLYKGDVFIATLDGRLVSLDAATGALNWETRTFETKDTFYSSTGATRVFDGKVLIGNGGAEFKARGFVSAYDAATGELAWRFYTVPGDPGKPFEHPDLAEAAKTWTGEWWKQGGGGTVWDSMVYDPELGLVYIGVGNGSHWNRAIRSPDGGDNLYLSSIVALKVDTGEYVWHYQTTPGDTWDYTATQPIIIADLDIDGRERKVLMQAPKNGFFYVIDRITGEFIDAEPFTYINWATGIDENGRPIEAEGARYLDGKAHWITPGSHGAHNWFPMSYNHESGLVYIPALVRPGAYITSPELGYGAAEAIAGKLGGSMSASIKMYKPAVIDTNPAAPKPGHASGRLIAYDPLAQREVWGVDQPSYYNGGLLSTTTGLLMQGDAEGMFSIRDTMTGEILWQFDVRSGAISSPITYMVDGEQYITLAVGWGGGQGQTHKKVERVHPGTIYTFKLGGTATAPAKLPAEDKPLTSLTTDASPVEIGNGFDVFMQNCVGCHSSPGAGGGALPDLGRAHDSILNNIEAILLQGAFASQGMPSFSGVLSEQDVKDLQAYIIHAAQAIRQEVPRQEFHKQMAEWQKLSDEASANGSGGQGS